MQFQDQVVWITGASSGIGEALALRVHQAGAKLILSARRERELQRVKAACTVTASVAILPFDLERLDDIPVKAEEALAQFGRIDVVVNNAGLSQRSPAKDTLLSVDERIIRLDYLAQVAVTKAVLPSMLERHKGHIIIISSLAGLAGVPLYSAYCAAKHALRGFFTSLRGELRDEGIRVTMVYPGTVKTNISLNAIRGDGSPVGLMTERHQAGMSAEVCSERILSEIAKGKDDVFVGT